MKCQNCSASLPDGAVFCGECGSPVQSKPKSRPTPQPRPQIQDEPQNYTDEIQAMPQENHENTPSINNKINCPRCGAENDKLYDRFCSSCGLPLQQRPQPRPAPPKPKTNTLLIVLIIIVAVLLIAVLGLFTYDYMIDNSNLVNNEPEQIAVTPEPITSTPAVVTPEPITVTQPPAPVFPNISASSTRGTDYTSGHAVNYYPEYAVDGIYETAWSSNREIELTPSITLSSGTAQYVTGVRVANGYFKTDEIYRNNRRITKFLIEYEGGQVIHYCGIDQYRIMQDIRFDTPVTTNYIKVQVLESYQGKWKDIAISEIEVY